MPNPINLVTLEEAQSALNTTDDLSDEITRASRIIRELIGPVIYEEVTEYLDGGRRLILSHIPVLDGSLTITDRKRDNQTVADFFLDPDTGMVEGYFPEGFRRWKGIYQTGWASDTAEVPQMIKKAVFLLIENEIDGGGAAEGIKKESIGDYSVEYFGGEATVSQNVLKRIEPYLSPFKEVNI